MPTECRRAAASDGAQHFPVGPVDPAEVVLNEAIALGANNIGHLEEGAESFFLPSPRTLDAVEAGDFAAHRADWGWPADAWARDAPIVPQEPTFASSAI